MAENDESIPNYKALFDDCSDRDMALELCVKDRRVSELRATRRSLPSQVLVSVPATLATLDEAAVRLRWKITWWAS